MDRVVVFGAAGQTGRHVVRHLLSQGRAVLAVVRRPEAMDAQDGLEVVKGDVLVPETWSARLAPGDVILSALGEGSSRAPTRVYSDGTAALVDAARAAGALGLVVVSAAPVSPAEEKTRFDRLVLHRVLGRVFRAAYADMRRMEQWLEAVHDLDWTVLRPPRLTRAAGSGTYRHAVGRPLRGARSLARPDLALALVDALERPEWRRRAVAVAA